MPLPSNTSALTGRTKMTRSEAARHAALVRYKKETAFAPATDGMANPKIRARVAEILAAKQKKAKGKAKGKGKKAPDPAKAKAKADREKAAAARKVEREKAKAERAGKQLANDVKRETAKREREKTKVERAAAQQKKQADQQKKLKAAARAKKEKAHAAHAKQSEGTTKKETSSSDKKQAANREKVAKDMADQDAGLAPAGAVALGDFADGKPLKPETATQFEAMGLVEKGSDGQHRLTTEGRAAANAMSKGDTRGAIDAISRAGDKKKAKGEGDKSDTGDATQEKADREQGDLLASIADNPKKLGYRQAGALERAGLVEKTRDGYQLTDKGKEKIAKRQKEIDAAKLNAGKALDMADYAIKQSDEERAMFAKMGAQGKLRPQNSKGNRPAPRKKARSAKKAGPNAKAKREIARLESQRKYIMDAPHRARDPMHQATLRHIEARLSTLNAGKALDMDENTLDDLVLAIKAGARHSRTDQQHIQAIHDSAVACGADCATDDEGDDEEMDMDGAEKAIKGIMDNPLYYAQHECGDIMQAANALSTMAMLIQSELAEEDEDTAHITMLCDGARTLVKFISAELDELEGAAGDAADDARMRPMKAVDIIRHLREVPIEDQMLVWEEIKAIAARDDVNPKAGTAEYGNVAFADAKNKKYPIDTADHVRAAWNYIAKEANAAKYDPDEVSQIKAKIVSAWKKLIDKAGPPSAGKAWDMEHVDGSAIKALEGDEIGGYAVLFGDAQNHDIERDFYTKATNFWLDDFGWPRPITYHHGMDAATRDNPVIGHWLKANVDDTGVWLTGQLDRAHAYYKAIKELAARGYLKLSSDSAPQWVQRERQSNGSNFVKRWPMITASCTVTPMEPRMLPVEVKAYLAEIGLDIDDIPEAINPDDARRDGVKASDDERARRMLLEWEWFNFEMETT